MENQERLCHQELAVSLWNSRDFATLSGCPPWPMASLVHTAVYGRLGNPPFRGRTFLYKAIRAAPFQDPSFCAEIRSAGIHPLSSTGAICNRVPSIFSEPSFFFFRHWLMLSILAKSPVRARATTHICTVPSLPWKCLELFSAENNSWLLDVIKASSAYVPPPARPAISGKGVLSC